MTGADASWKRALDVDAVWDLEPLTGVECDEILQAADAPTYLPVGEWRTVYNVDSPPVRRVIAVLEAVNERFWRLPVRNFEPNVNSYGPSTGFGRHMDYNPSFGADFPCVSLAASVQLSDPDGYGRGEVRLDDGRTLPKQRGTIGVWPSWTPHEVVPLTWGVRSALVVFAHGWPTIGEARREGWPGRWR